ncbi:MAG: DUF1272 domain-containing protein [Planctomycetota bacterium]
MLEMHPDCLACQAALPADQPGAFVCSFECTYCRPCAEALGGSCPACDGEMLPRPRRTGAALERHPQAPHRGRRAIR